MQNRLHVVIGGYGRVGRYLARMLWKIKEEGGVYFSRGSHRNPLLPAQYSVI